MAKLRIVAIPFMLTIPGSLSFVPAHNVKMRQGSFLPSTLASTARFDLEKAIHEEPIEVWRAFQRDEDGFESTATLHPENARQDVSSQTPAEKEDVKFECDESVQFWRDFQRDGFQSADSNLREIMRITRDFMQSGPDGLDYWLRHIGRIGYFFVNAILGILASSLAQRFEGSATAKNPFRELDISIVSETVLESSLCFEQDYKRIKKGLYPKPWDMYYNTRQASPIYAATQTSRFIKEAIATHQRRVHGTSKDKAIHLSSDEKSSFAYPEYYQTAFHYQTNGWMSERSANVYETSTETLFVGRQDAMQRIALPELVKFTKERKKSLDRPVNILEIACGTGRFMTFCRDSLPLDTKYTAIDLSPYYLDMARENDANWRTCRQQLERKRHESGVDIPEAAILQAKAEDLPFQEGEFDAVVCNYLFHELPRAIRAQVASEAARVTRLGGLVVFCDSTQLGDRPVFDDRVGRFTEMNEPFYVDYISDVVFDHFERAGLECGTKMVASLSKSLTFTKPS